MPFYFVFKKHKITEYACHKHMASDYHCIQRVIRIISMNKRIIHKKCGGFDGYFYAFNKFSGLYFHLSKDTSRSQRSVQLVARIKGVNKLI